MNAYEELDTLKALIQANIGFTLAPAAAGSEATSMKATFSGDGYWDLTIRAAGIVTTSEAFGLQIFRVNGGETDAIVLTAGTRSDAEVSVTIDEPVLESTEVPTEHLAALTEAYRRFADADRQFKECRSGWAKAVEAARAARPTVFTTAEGEGSDGMDR